MFLLRRWKLKFTNDNKNFIVCSATRLMFYLKKKLRLLSDINVAHSIIAWLSLPEFLEVLKSF